MCLCALAVTNILTLLDKYLRRNDEEMIVKIIGIVFVVIGTIVSMIFWVPGLIDKRQLRQIMGNRYSMIYFIYFTNGPLLLIIGALILTYLA